MQIDDQIKIIKDLGYSVDYNLKLRLLTCIYKSNQIQVNTPLNDLKIKMLKDYRDFINLDFKL